MLDPPNQRRAKSITTGEPAVGSACVGLASATSDHVVGDHTEENETKPALLISRAKDIGAQPK